MKFIEILGFPGSGKSTLKEKINKKKLIFSLEYIFYQSLFSENKNISLLQYKFLYYLNKKKFYDIAFDNYLRKKNYLANIIKKKINHSNNDFYKNNRDGVIQCNSSLGLKHYLIIADKKFDSFSVDHL